MTEEIRKEVADTYDRRARSALADRWSLHQLVASNDPERVPQRTSERATGWVLVNHRHGANSWRRMEFGEDLT